MCREQVPPGLVLAQPIHTITRNACSVNCKWAQWIENLAGRDRAALDDIVVRGIERLEGIPFLSRLVIWPL